MCWCIAIAAAEALGMPDDCFPEWAGCEAERAGLRLVPVTPAILVGFAGMTHLGIVSAVATAARGFSVLGYDSHHDLIARLQSGGMPVVEPELDALAAEHRERIAFTDACGDLARCDVV